MTLHLIERLAVEEEGDGPVVVCVHGLGGSSNTWTPLMPALARHRVIRVDLPGSGRSQGAEGALSIERYVQALVSVCARLNVTRAHWLGHSMGTIVCQHLAASHPELVASLALFGPLIAPPDAARTACGGATPSSSPVTSSTGASMFSTAAGCAPASASQLRA